MMAEVDRPLSGLHVVDLVEGPLAPITRYLAELGARVDRFAAKKSEAFMANAGKHLHIGQPTQDVLGNADIIVLNAGRADIDIDALRPDKPALVVMRVSDFGNGNDLSRWQATDAVLHALSGELARSGIKGRAPLLPPGQLAYQCAASQGAYLLLASYYRALRSGKGDLLDFAALDGAVQALDPGFGVSGSATMGRPAHLLSRDRPPFGTLYPIFPCADGHVRICLLAPRQWQGMFRWMGEPADFADPSFNKINTRQQSVELNQALAAFFRDQPRAELEALGQAHGVPISAMLTFEEFAESKHLQERKAITHFEDADGKQRRLPNGVITIDGERMGPYSPPSNEERASEQREYVEIGPPFEGLCVLDLGVIVVGAEAGRMFADGGADVIKVESAAFPDGSRQSYLPYDMSVSFATGHRNKRSLGLDLRDPKGREIFLQMVAKTDVIFSNFKPGTMESLGLDHRTLATINPRIVTAESSAFGSTGAWAKRMGYGPLVRAATGLSGKWRYADDPASFSDAVTIYPDHVAGRISAMAAIALLIRRERTGLGGAAEISQAEVMLAHFGDEIEGSSADANELMQGVYPALGEDEWCVIAVRHDRDWQALVSVVGHSLSDPQFVTTQGRKDHRKDIDAKISEWTSTLEAHAIAQQLQAARIPAAPMLRLGDLPDYPYYKQRQLFRSDAHPWLDQSVISENHMALCEVAPPTSIRPAPLMGEQTKEVIQDWLGLSPETVAELIDATILQPTAQQVYDAIDAHRAASATGSEAR